MDFGQAIREIRLRKKYSQVDFAEKLKISRVALNGIEKGRHNPSQKVVNALQKEFGISKTQLVLIALSEDDVEEVKQEMFKDVQNRLLSMISQ